MARAEIKVGLSSRGASLAATSRDLRRMDGRQVKDIFRRHLENAARPYPTRVRASALAIPAKPGGKSTGLRARIAGCVELSSGTDAKSAYVSVWVNPFRMRPDYTTLPLYMEGATGRAGRDNRGYARWRHPVYGHAARPWVQQPSHPYFYKPVTPLGRESGPAIEGALDDITRKLNG